jgi:hypothetical protein
MNLLEENPFDLTKASDFTNTQINDYWVDMVAKDKKGLIDLIKPRSVMPMIILGSKGCGKTHLMRYCSEPVQLMRNNNDIIETIKNERYLGIYIRADALNAGRFFGKNQNNEIWYNIFSYYFELWLSLHLLEIINKVIKKTNNKQERDIVKLISKLISNKVDIIETMDSLIKSLEDNKKNIDRIVNNCAITRKIEKFDIVFSPGDMLFGVPEIINSRIDILSDTIFIYLIDEIENFSEEQQIFINTLIRFRRGMTSIKIGARLYGVKTYNTSYPSNEKIKVGAEFEEINLDKFMRNEKKYSLFIKKLVIKRLKIYNNNISLDKSININSFFEVIDSDKYYSNETIKIVTTRNKKPNERIYFNKLKENIKKYTLEKRINRIIENLIIPEYPLLEKLNIYIFYQSFLKKDIDLVELSEKIKYVAGLFITTNGKQKSKTYYQSYQHFNNDLLAQLYREYERSIPYAGFETIIQLSQGAPRNTLSILKNIYRWAVFNGEEPFGTRKISIKSQTEGIADTAEWFWDDAQLDNNGNLIRIAINNLAVLFRYIRYSFKPTECDLSSFSIDIDILSKNARETIKNAENRSFILCQKNGRNGKNSQKINYSFQLAPILTPKWGLSQRRGGTIELSTELAEAIFCASKEKFNIEIKKRLKSVSFEFNRNLETKINKNQIDENIENYYIGELFDDLEN